MPIAAAETLNPGPPVNAHIHLPPNFSAFDSVAQAVTLAAEQGVRVLGASNYYDFGVYSEFERRAREAGLFPLFGLETIALLEDLQRAGVKINDPGNPGKMYLCGKGITRCAPPSPQAEALLETLRRSDSERMAEMTARLAGVFAAVGLELDLDIAAIKAAIVRRHGSAPEAIYLQERHLAQAFQEALFARLAAEERAAVLERLFGAPPRDPEDAVGVQNEIRSHLMKAGRPAYVAETFVGFDHAYRLILALGGIPCYPTLADGARPICAFEEPVEKLIPELRRRGIHAAELIPGRNDPEVLRRYVLAMREAGMVVTAGTEHNTLDLLPLAPACLGGVPIPDELRAIFWEGACVVAAHQELCIAGEPGFVQENGVPNPAFRTDEERIRAFARRGAEAIARRLGLAGG
jgi:predicted metal-dependent phosphoesterase TrpH